MLLIIYNSNPQNKPDLPTIKGWSLFTPEDWQSVVVAVDDYFFHMPPEDAELYFGVEGIHGIYYDSYKEWLADYQVSEVEDKEYAYTDLQFLNTVLGTNFYTPDIAQNTDDELTYPEMDVD